MELGLEKNLCKIGHGGTLNFKQCTKMASPLCALLVGSSARVFSRASLPTSLAEHISRLSRYMIHFDVPMPVCLLPACALSLQD